MVNDKFHPDWSLPTCKVGIIIVLNTIFLKVLLISVFLLDAGNDPSNFIMCNNLK